MRGGEKMSSKLLLAVVVIIVIVGAIALMGNKKGKSELPVSNSYNTAPTTQATQSQPENKMEKTSVEVTSSGFVPQTITVKAGTKVVWTNKSGAVVTVNSALHPTHLIYPPLNLGEFANDQSVQLVFDKPGTYKYHNHLNASQTGTVVVE